MYNDYKLLTSIHRITIDKFTYVKINRSIHHSINQSVLALSSSRSGSETRLKTEAFPTIYP